MNTDRAKEFILNKYEEDYKNDPFFFPLAELLESYHQQRISEDWPSKEKIKIAIETTWERLANDPYHAAHGLNPYAYKEGFEECAKWLRDTYLKPDKSK